MSIISLTYFFFIALLLAVYYVMPHRFQGMVLLIGSLSFFLMSGTPWTIIYLIAASSVTWYASNKIQVEVNDTPRGKRSIKAKVWLAAALIVDLGILTTLKYMNFLLLNISYVYNRFVSEKVLWSVKWPVALGVSFYTLQIVGYLLDSYWNICKPEKNFFKFLLFSCFFPQMISGPISRFSQLGNELNKEHSFDMEMIRSGVWRIFIGIIKKIALAENLAIFVPYFFTNDNGRTGPIAFIGMLAYVLQIYADFSGYMDIVLGTAECFGIKMIENFNAPFSSRSIQEFWQRWHITLGLWLRDYVMFPLLHSSTWVSLGKKIKKSHMNGMLAKKIPTWLAMLVLWFCMGLWHGGGWNYIVEGIWFWAVIVLGNISAPFFKNICSRWNDNSLWIKVQQIRTILIYSIGATFFRFPTVHDGLEALVNVFSPAWIHNLEGIKGTLSSYIGQYGRAASFGYLANALIVFVLFCVCSKFGGTENGVCKKILQLSKYKRVLLFIVLGYILLFTGVYGDAYNAKAFIYGGF